MGQRERWERDRSEREDAGGGERQEYVREREGERERQGWEIDRSERKVETGVRERERKKKIERETGAGERESRRE